MGKVADPQNISTTVKAAGGGADISFASGVNGEPSKYQRDVIRHICEKSWENEPTVGEVLRAKNVPFEDYMTYCQGDLLGIMKIESGFNCNAENTATKREKSYGCFQIRLDMPSRRHITVKEAKDLFFSSAWTISRLVGNDWMPRTINGKINRYSVQCHNGCNANNGYWQNAVAWSNQFIKKYDL